MGWTRALEGEWVKARMYEMRAFVSAREESLEAST